MMHYNHIIRLLSAILLSFCLGCASSADLTRDARQSVAAGDYPAAVDQLLKALDKDQTNTDARMLLRELCGPWAQEQRTTIRDLSERDLPAAADAIMALQKQITRIADEQVDVPADETWITRERDIRRRAAETMLARAEEESGESRFKRAYRTLLRAEQYDAETPGLADQLRETRELAVHRVVFLPWKNRTDYPALTRALLDNIQHALARDSQRLAGEFVEIVPMQKVFDILPVAKLDNLTADEAFSYTTQVGGNTFVIGSLANLKTHEANLVNTESIYWRTELEDVDGRVVQRQYQRVPITVSRQERRVELEFTIEVISVQDKDVLEREQGGLTAADAVTTTDYQVLGDPEEDYTLYDPSVADPGGQMRQLLRLNWQQKYPETSLSRLLTVTRAQFDRQFHPDSPWATMDIRQDLTLDEPPALAEHALQDVWDAVLRQVRRLNRVEPER